MNIDCWRRLSERWNWRWSFAALVLMGALWTDRRQGPGGLSAQGLPPELPRLIGPPLLVEGPPAPPGFSFGTVAATELPPNPWDATLSICITNIVDTAVVDYWQVAAALDTAGGGTGVIPIVCYSGPAYWITITNGSTVVVEYSNDTRTWQAFPTANFQMTFQPGTNSFFVPCELGPRFYRTRNV